MNMALVKLCNACGEKNAAHVLFCEKCDADISAIAPLDEAAVRASAEKIPTSAPSPAEPDAVYSASAAEYIYVIADEMLTFITEDGQEFAVKPGDIVGRADDSAGTKILRSYETVSRKHLQVSRQDGRWLVKNLSSNHTWVNERRLAEQESTQVEAGDQLKLSTKCRLTVFV